MALLEIILIAAVFLIAGIPLHISANLVGGNSSLLKAALTNAIVGLCLALIYVFLYKYASIIGFIAVLLIYKAMFDIGWLRALLVWLLQGVIAFVLLVLLILLGLIAL